MQYLFLYTYEWNLHIILYVISLNLVYMLTKILYGAENNIYPNDKFSNQKLA